MTRVAAIQMVSGADIADNLRSARRLAERAVAGGARLILLPENFALLAAQKLYAAGVAERTAQGPMRSFASQLASELGAWVIAGSIPVAMRPDGTLLDARVRAVCFVYDEQGAEVARYDKVHLFDVDVEDQFGRYRESEAIEPGTAVQVIDTPCGRVGLSICYDLRFPELYRGLLEQGAQVIVVPAAFTAATGAVHWQALLRARAIENLCYVIAADQGGQHSATRASWGHSMIIDPWGKIVAEHAQGEAVVAAEIDLDYLRKMRRQMPVASHRRL